MSLSLDFASLGAAYRAATATPGSVARDVLGRIEARGDDGVWISKTAPQDLLAQAAAIERRAARDGMEAMPLYGLPFAVKDNIDAAGLPTSVACPSFSHMPEGSAPAVARLIEAGALLVGKTNLDQFATGLVGTRSPYGVPHNPFDPAYIPGGSSSGSAVAVAAGLVSFALGTDTAGSGRVPAAFNNIVGLKPTRGLVSTRGVVPACASLDCVSVFALTVADVAAVLDRIAGFDPDNPQSRPAPAGFAAFGTMPANFVFGVPRSSQLEFFGNADAESLFDAAFNHLVRLGGKPIEIDFAPFQEVAALLYGGPWLDERRAAVAAAIGDRHDLLHPVTRRIVEGRPPQSAAELFAAQEILASCRQRTRETWQAIDVMLLPTTGTIYRIDEVEAEPLRLNENLGRYTNFTNLLDLSALAVPNGFCKNGLPTGVTLLAPAFHDGLLAGIGAAFQRQRGLPLGATGMRMPAAAPPPAAVACYPYLPLAVVGAHLSGQPLNYQLLDLGARLRRHARTTTDYRLYVLPDGTRPGMVKHPGKGQQLKIEIWDVPAEGVGIFLAGIAPPLGLGTLALEDGGTVTGFLCEAHAVTDAARDITEFGGWAAYLADMEP